MILGVDYDSYKATLCLIPYEPVIASLHVEGGGTSSFRDRAPERRPQIAVASFRPAKTPGEDAAIDALKVVRLALSDALCQFDMTPEPIVAFVERGFGMSRRADWTLGAFYGAIYSSLDSILNPDDAVNSMKASEWKATVTRISKFGLTKDGRGNGNVKKEIANGACRMVLLDEYDTRAETWTPDALDAFGIAYTGMLLNDAAVRSLPQLAR